MSWLNRLLNLLRRDELSRTLDEELQFHVDSRTRDNLKSGMTPEAARLDAGRRFGNPMLAKERTRDMDIIPSLESIGQDLRYALRGLRRSPGFTTVAVLALALGIGANTAVFTVVNGVLLRPLPFPASERLFLISCKPPQPLYDSGPGLSDHHYLEFQRQNQAFERIATFGQNQVTLTGVGDAVRLPVAMITPSLLPTLRVNPAMGRVFLPDEDQPDRSGVALLGDKLWRGHLGADPNILGKTITLDGIPRRVIGVMPAGFTFPYDAELWLPVAVGDDPHNSFFRPVVGRLKPGVSAQQAQAELEAFAGHVPKRTGEKSALASEIRPLKDLLTRSIRKSLVIFMGAVAFVLLIACANVANLLLMRGASRRQEIAVRAALGAGRRRLIRQLLTESTLVSLGGGTAGILLAVWGVPALLGLAPKGRIPRIEEIHIDAWVLAATFGVAVLTGILFGLAPAFQSTRSELRESLNASGRAITRGRERLRSALVVAEIALALVLLTGAGLMLKSFSRILAVDPGFHPENVLTMSVDLPGMSNFRFGLGGGSVYQTAGEIQAFHARILDKLSRLPGVTAAGAVNWLPMRPWFVQGDFHLEGGRPLPPHYMVQKPAVSPEYFRVMGIRLLSGRGFTGQDNSSAPGVAIVSQGVARSVWPGEDPIGKRITLEDHPKPGDWLTIVGVVDDVKQRGLTKKADPAIYQSLSQVLRPFFLSHMTFVVRTAANASSTAAAMRGLLREVDKDQPALSIATMSDVISETTAEPRFQARLISLFSILALLLSAIGIYGVLAYSVNERTHELGIRIALGAGKTDITRLVLRRGFALVTAGVALGVAGAVAVTRVLEAFLFEVKPTDPATFAMVAALLAAVALLAGLLPARRANRVDPLVALRLS
jgi:predicted permease